MAQLVTFRDTLLRLVPRWLRATRIWSVLYTLALHVDAVVEMMRLGVRARFPNLDSGEPLTLLTNERKMQRGPGVSDTDQASTLRRWLDAHRRRGGPHELLRQLHEFWRAFPFVIDLVYYTASHFSMATDGTITRDILNPWNPVSDPAHPFKWWLFYDWPVPVPDHTWGDGTKWGDRTVYGSGLTVDEVGIILAVPQAWNTANAKGEVVLLADDAHLWGFPAAAWGDLQWGGTKSVRLKVDRGQLDTP